MMFCWPADVIFCPKIAQNCTGSHILEIQKFSRSGYFYERKQILDLYWTNDNEEYNSRFASLIVRITLSWKWNGSLWFLIQFWDSITPLKFLEQPLHQLNQHFWAIVKNLNGHVKWRVRHQLIHFHRGLADTLRRSLRICEISYERSRKKTWTRPFGSTMNPLCEIVSDIKTGYQSKYP